MFPQLYAFLTNPIFALVIGLIINALQAAGLISVRLSRLLLVAAWILAVVGAVSAMNDPPIRHQVIVALLVGIPSAILLIGVNMFISRYERSRQPKQPDPLSFSAVTQLGPHARGTVIAGIPWSPRFIDLRLSIHNPNETDLYDLDLHVSSDRPIASIGQLTNLSNVDITPDAEPQVVIGAYSPAGEPRWSRALPLIGTTRKMRIQCARLGKRQSLNFIAASTDFPDFKAVGSPPEPNETQRHFVMHFVSKDDGSANWYGYGADENGRIEDVFVERPSAPTEVKIAGTFRTKDLTCNVDETLTVANPVTHALPGILEQIRSETE